MSEATKLVFSRIPERQGVSPAYGARGWMYLDRIVFHRADYASLLSEISSAVQQHVEPQPLISHITSALKAAMEAESVVFS
jgi:hypothetical protein